MGDSAQAREADVRVVIVALYEKEGVLLQDTLPSLHDMCTLLERCYGYDFWLSYGVDLKTRVISETVLKCSHIKRLLSHNHSNITLYQLGTLLGYFEQIPSSSVSNFSTSDLEDIIRIIPSFVIAESDAAMPITDEKFNGCVDYLKAQSEAIDADLSRMTMEGAKLDKRLQETFEEVSSFVTSGGRRNSSRNLKYIELLKTGDFDHIFGLLRRDIADSERSVGFVRTVENDDSGMQGVFESLLKKQIDQYDVFTDEVFDKMKRGKGGLAARADAGAGVVESAGGESAVAIPDALIEETIQAVSESVSACRNTFDIKLKELTDKYSLDAESKLSLLRSVYQKQSAACAEIAERESRMWLDDLKTRESKTDVYNAVLENSLNSFLRESKGIIKEYHDVLQKAQAVVMHRSAEVGVRGKSYGDLVETPKTNPKILKKTKMIDELTKEHSKVLREEAARYNGRGKAGDGEGLGGSNPIRTQLEQRVNKEVLNNLNTHFDLAAIDEAHRLRMAEEWA